MDYVCYPFYSNVEFMPWLFSALSLWIKVYPEWINVNIILFYYFHCKKNTLVFIIITLIIIVMIITIFPVSDWCAPLCSVYHMSCNHCSTLAVQWTLHELAVCGWVWMPSDSSATSEAGCCCQPWNQLRYLSLRPAPVPQRAPITCEAFSNQRGCCCACNQQLLWACHTVMFNLKLYSTVLDDVSNLI